MSFISPADTARMIEQDAVTLIDCRFRLTDPGWGRQQYAQGHLPGAGYAHLDDDLACLGGGPGRHPLPRMSGLHASLRRLGVRAGRQVVVYDDAGGAIAARLWWLLRYVGHSDAAILDGGWQAWVDAALRVSREPEAPPEGDRAYREACMPVVDLAAVGRLHGTDGALLIDARSAPRYVGEHEPIDARAGHIPGSVNRPFDANLQDGRLKARPRLEAEWRELLGAHSPTQVIHMCGSGVTACFNLACMEYLGAGGSALFVPSWSGWIENPDNPIATGPNPAGVSGPAATGI